MSFKERKFNLLLKRTQNRINRQISQGCTQPSPYKESVIQLWSVCLIWQWFELDALSDATLGIYPGLGLVLGVYWLPMAGLDEKVNNTLFTCPTLGQHWVYWQDWDLKKPSLLSIFAAFGGRCKKNSWAWWSNGESRHESRMTRFSSNKWGVLVKK